MITENEVNIYQVFATYSIEIEEYYINTIFNSDNDYNDFLNKINNRSNYKYNVPLDENDKILTLSSCTDGGKKRVVLHAKKIRSNDINE